MPFLLFCLVALAVTGYGAFHLLSLYTTSFFAAALLLLFPFLLAMLAAELFSILMPRKKIANARLALLSLFCSLLLAEGALRLFKVNATYPELIGQHRYFSPYWNDKNYWFVYQPDDTLSYSRKDFPYFRITNSLGIPERELNLADTGAVKKILCLGDSFTEGMGAPADSAWCRLLENYLNSSSDDSFVVYNAGIAGSDPVYEEHLLHGKLWNVNWTAVIFCINGTDLEDCKIRGGMERFRADSTVAYRKPPAWEPFYATSYLFRLTVNNILGYDQFFLSKTENRKLGVVATDNIRTVLFKARQELDERNIHLIVVAHPLKGEAEMKAFSNPYMDTLLSQMDDLKPLNLLPYFADSLPDDPQYKNLYWQHDAHFKPEGYSIMAEKISRELAVRKIIHK